MAESTKTSALGARYAEHNRRRGRGFIYGGRERIDALRAAMSGVVPGLVLDLGCRDGSLSSALGLAPERTIGADIDPEALAAAAMDGSLHACLVDLWGPLPFATASFDVVVAGEILEHVPFPADLVAEVARVVKPGGRFIGSVPNAFRLKNRILFLGGRWFEADPTHLRHFSPSMLRALLNPHFADVNIVPCVGRWVHYSPRLLGNDLVWSGVRS
jgi:SAM-dependent methyltransferase